MRGAGLLILFVLALSATAVWDMAHRPAPDAEDAWRVEWASFEGGYGIDLAGRLTLCNAHDEDMLLY